MGNYHAIRKQLGGEDAEPWYVIHKGTLILGLCIRKDFNPKVESNPSEVWVGTQEDVALWGDRLANDTGAIPLYVRHAGDDYQPKGIYHVLDRQHTEAELAAARAKVPHGLSRIVFLKPA